MMKPMFQLKNKKNILEKIKSEWDKLENPDQEWGRFE